MCVCVCVCVCIFDFVLYGFLRDGDAVWKEGGGITFSFRPNLGTVLVIRERAEERDEGRRKIRRMCNNRSAGKDRASKNSRSKVRVR